MAEAFSVVISAALMALAPVSVAQADGATRFVGMAQPLGGKTCGPSTKVTIHIQGRELTFVAVQGPMFRGTLRADDSFRALPVSEATINRRMLAAPVREGRIASDNIAGDIKSRWCTYRFSAQRS